MMTMMSMVDNDDQFWSFFFYKYIYSTRHRLFSRTGIFCEPYRTELLANIFFKLKARSVKEVDTRTVLRSCCHNMNMHIHKFIDTAYFQIFEPFFVCSATVVKVQWLFAVFLGLEKWCHMRPASTKGPEIF